MESYYTVDQESDSAQGQRLQFALSKTEDIDAEKLLRDNGQNQPVEPEIAERSLEQCMTVETRNDTSNIRNVIKGIFKAVSNESTEYFDLSGSYENLELMFPCLLWNGKGAPPGTLVTITKRDWVSYVLRISSLTFQGHIIFICFFYVFFRRRKISDLTTFKPMSSSVRESISKIMDLSKHGDLKKVSERTINSLCSKINMHLTDLPGSVSEMRRFRNDFLSMMNKFGPLSIFFTVSAADSIWSDTIFEVKNRDISIEKASTVSAKERADVIAPNPVKLTLSWKRRIKALLELILNGKSKPFGDIAQYAYKAEWQGRLSEHAHFLLWLKDPIPPLDLTNAELRGEQNHVLEKAESLSTAFLSEYKETCEETEISKRTDNIQEVINRMPSELEEFLKSDKFGNDIRDIATSCQLHIHSSYCSRNKQGQRIACKSHFTFKVQNESKIHKLTDEKQNVSYRIHLRRNQSMINNFNSLILNLWRANIDVSVLCGDAFSSIIYVTFYTSKIDKTAEIREVLNKLKASDLNNEPGIALRNMLSNIDSCRCVGAPEAASNLLVFPYKKTSAKVLRIDTRKYIQALDTQGTADLVSVQDLVSSFTKGNENFDEQIRNNKSSLLKDSLCIQYYNRPDYLYDPLTNSWSSGNNMSMANYVENYRVTKRRNVSRGNQVKDKTGNIVEPRKENEKKNVIGLKT